MSLTARSTPDAKRPLAAMLLPLSGEGADLGRSMAHAGGLAQPDAGGKEAGKGALPVFDTQGTAAGAATAARAALKAGAPLLLGPLYAREIATVVDAAGEVPVLSFSNDAAAARGRAYLMGVTASQAVEAVLSYARTRGVRRVTVIADASLWGTQAAAAAQQLAGDIGVTLSAATQATWRTGPLPDAVLISGGGMVGAAAREYSAAGVQVLATLQAAEQPSRGLAALDGAWLAAPDPERFADFARGFEGKYGNMPGVLAGLAYDAVNIARALRRAGHVDRDGLLAPAGFGGVTGNVRFNRDGSAARELAIMVVEGGTLRVVERSQSG